MKKLIASSLAVVAAVSASYAQTVVNSDITSNATWSGTVILETTIFVKNDAVLTIQPGTIVRGQPRQAAGSAASDVPGSLVVTSAGTIIAEGTASQPIIFTTAAVDNNSDGIADDDDTSGFADEWTTGDAFLDADPLNSPLPILAPGNQPGVTNSSNLSANLQLWGGLVVLGEAPTNLGTTDNATALVGNIEGLPASADSEFGGNIVNDNSGILRYVSVRHGGSILGSANEINGITLGGVGNGTTIEFCEVYCTEDDGFEFFGGTVDTNNLVVYAAGDDQFDGDQGWVGRNQFWVAVMAPVAIGANTDEGFEFDGDDGDRNLDGNGTVFPFPAYSVYNATLVGSAGATGYNNSGMGAGGRIEVKSNYSGEIVNTIVVNTPGGGLNDQTGNPVVISNCTFDDVDATTTNAALAGVTSVNNFVNAGVSLLGEDQGVAGGLDLRPGFALGGQFANSIKEPSGYVQTTFRGAVDPNALPGQTWLAGWTVLSKSGILVD